MKTFDDLDNILTILRKKVLSERDFSESCQVSFSLDMAINYATAIITIN